MNSIRTKNVEPHCYSLVLKFLPYSADWKETIELKLLLKQETSTARPLSLLLSYKMYKYVSEVKTKSKLVFTFWIYSKTLLIGNWKKCHWTTNIPLVFITEIIPYFISFFIPNCGMVVIFLHLQIEVKKSPILDSWP